ncbi:MAG: hypothetical protein P4L65_09330 [Legionella sp.]|nr:hypothetical protein [Legionella sp.]
MQSKVEKTPPKKNPSPSQSSKYLSLEQQNDLWRYTNIAFTAVVTSTAITVAVEPFNRALTNHAMHGKFNPAYLGVSSFTPAALSFARSIYGKSTVTSIYGGTAKSGVAVSGKNNTKAEEIHEEPVHNNTPPFKGIAATVMVDYLITKPSSTYANLQKANIVPNNFSWLKNIGGLMRSNIASTLTSSSINFYMMLYFQPQIAQKLTIKNKDTKNICSGIISGILAAGATLPFNTWIDKTALKTTVNSNGKLVNPSAFTLINDMTQTITTDPKVMKEAFTNMIKAYPIRAFRVATTFATIAGISGKLGQFPLGKKTPELSVSGVPQSFFASSAKANTPQEDLTPQNQQHNP